MQLNPASRSCQLANARDFPAIESGNPGSVIAPTNPNSFLAIGPHVWISDSKGIFSYATDPSNPTPLETGIYSFKKCYPS